MSVVASLKEKRREKQRLFEMKLLRELTLTKINEQAEMHFASFFHISPYYKGVIEDICIDTAIESYLVGAQYSRFGHYGESVSSAQKRSKKEIRELIHSLFEYFVYYRAVGESDLIGESLYMACDHFVDYWWKHGFEIGKKRRRLRLN